jgi:hypothetical protein
MRNYLLRRLASGLKVCFVLLCFFHGAELFAQGTGLAKCYADKDGDGFGDPNDWVFIDVAFGCGGFNGTAGRVDNGLDCNDNDAIEHPGAIWYENFDEDDFTTGRTIEQCSRPPGYTTLAELYQGDTYCDIRAEALDFVDCDDNTQNDINQFKYWFVDNDKDGAVAGIDQFILSCAPPPVQPGFNYTMINVCAGVQVDCNDNDPLSYPGQEWYLDGDGDGFPLNSTPEFTQCQVPPGGFYKTKQQLTSLSEDCDDSDPAIFPATWYEDQDGDGLSTGNDIVACGKPDGYISLPGGALLIDCDDTDPGATIVLDWFPDADGDRHGGGPGITSCKRPLGYFNIIELVSLNDCNDNNENIHPGALEYCNGVDDDCDFLVDETFCCPTGNILYVNANAAGANNGTSWANAFTRLQDALETARRCTIATEIWVAGGTYYPDEGGTANNNSIHVSFMPRGGLAIYGGFAGTETLLSQRQLSAAKSILSGEVQQDGTASNNTINILILENITTAFVLDGFTIKDGYSNIAFPANQARGIGILVLNSTNAVQIKNCTITGNTGHTGAALSNVSSDPVYINCVITGNTTITANGAVWNDNASPIFVNCTIANNAISGSDLIVIRNTGTSSPAIYNSIVRGTSPAMSGGTPVVTNSLIQNPTVWLGTGNSNADPLFVNEGGGDLHLQAASPAINAGANGFNTEATDLEGNLRKVGGIIDMGAYESPHGCSDPLQWVIDSDNDHYYTGDPLAACVFPGAPYIPKTDHQPGDCNDSDPAIHPATIWYRDADGDGYNLSDPIFITQPSCTPPGPGYATTTKGPDCNDNDATLNPETVWYRDADGDGYHLSDPFFITQPSCTSPGAGYSRTTKGPDCNDGNAAINPGTVWVLDADGDTYYAASFTGCSGPAGYKIRSGEQPGDCNDADAAINPQTIWYLDADGDGYNNTNFITQPSCTPPGTGFKTTTKGPDCNDNSGAQNPETVWVLDADGDGYYTNTYTGCLGTQGYAIQSNQQPGDCNDADGTVHSPIQYYVDGDKDGYGSATTAMLCSSVTPVGYSTNNTDCNDADAAIHPATVWIKDSDQDGYYASLLTQCTSPGPDYRIRTTQLAGDCADHVSTVNPAVAEVCGNGVDENCDGQADEGCNNKVLLNINSVSVYEAPGAVAQLTVSLTRRLDKPVTVSYTTADGTARSKANKNAPADFTATSGKLTIPAGSLTASVNISIANDGVTEVPETFTVLLSRPVNVGIGTATGVVTILDPVLTRSKAVQAAPEVIHALAVQALPNPSYHRFALVIKSGSDQPVGIRVVDMAGRLVEARSNLAANGTFYLGDRYRPGVYLVQVAQGAQKQIVKLVKQSD